MKRSVLRCATHGKVKWQYDFMCHACGATFVAKHLSHGKIIYEGVKGDGKCPNCGAVFLLTKAEREAMKAEGKRMRECFSARPVCHQCAERASLN